MFILNAYQLKTGQFAADQPGSSTIPCYLILNISFALILSKRYAYLKFLT